MTLYLVSQSGIQIDPRPGGASVGIQSGGLQSGHYGSGSIGVFHLQSGLTTSGLYLSGSIGSGQVSWAHLSSGTVRSGHLGNNSVTSGNIASGLVGQMHLASGAVNSGHVGSGTIPGFFGPTRVIQSGTIGSFDFGSGAVTAGSVGSGSVQSGNIASGQIGRGHISSGILSTEGYIRGLKLYYISSGQIVVSSGFCYDQSGYVQIGTLTNITINISGSNNGPGGMDISPIGNVSILTSGLIVSGAVNSFLWWPIRTGTGNLTISGTYVAGLSGTDFINQVAVGDLVGRSGSSFWRATVVNSGNITISLSGGLSSGAVQVIENAYFCTSGQISQKVDNLLSGVSLSLVSVPFASGGTIPGFIGGSPNSSGAGTMGQSHLMTWIGKGQSGVSAWLSTQRTTPLISGILGYVDNYRRIGSVIYNGASGVILPFSQMWDATTRRVVLEIATAQHKNRIGSSLSATSWTSIDCTTIAPPTATSVLINLLNLAPQAAVTFSVRQRNTGGNDNTRNMYSSVGSGQRDSNYVECACDGAQYIDYIFATAPGNTPGFIEGGGYVETL